MWLLMGLCCNCPVLFRQSQVPEKRLTSRQLIETLALAINIYTDTGLLLIFLPSSTPANTMVTY